MIGRVGQDGLKKITWYRPHAFFFHKHTDKVHNHAQGQGPPLSDQLESVKYS